MYTIYIPEIPDPVRGSDVVNPIFIFFIFKNYMKVDEEVMEVHHK